MSSCQLPASYFASTFLFKTNSLPFSPPNWDVASHSRQHTNIGMALTDEEQRNIVGDAHFI